MKKEETKNLEQQGELTTENEGQLEELEAPKSNNRLMLILALVIGVVVIGGVAWAMRGKKATKKEAQKTQVSNFGSATSNLGTKLDKQSLLVGTAIVAGVCLGTFTLGGRYGSKMWQWMKNLKPAEKAAEAAKSA